MGLGKLKNGKHQPISRYEDSWAHQMQLLREGKVTFEQVYGPRQPRREDLWVTLGPCDHKGNLLPKTSL